MNNFLILIFLHTPFSFASTDFKSARQCFSCHTAEHKAWLNSPHSKSYNDLQKLIAIENRDVIPSSYYNIINDQIESFCVKCHAPNSVYDFLIPSKRKNSLDTYIEQFQQPQPVLLGSLTSKKQDKDLGVDCLTCHVKEGKVITSNEPTKTNKPTCNPIQLKGLSRDFSCVSCHADQYYDAKSNSKDSENSSCIKCHYNNSSTKVFSHTLTHAAKSNKLAAPYIRLLDNFSIKKNKNIINFKVKNEFVPHRLSYTPETVFHFTGLNGKHLQTIRFNREYYHGLEVIEGGNKPIPRFNMATDKDIFYDFLPSSKPLFFKIKIEDNVKQIRLEVISKPQFFIRDLHGRNILNSFIDINKATEDFEPLSNLIKDLDKN